MAVAEVPTGAIADRFGRKVSLAMGALLYGLGMFAFAAKVMSPVFVIGYLLWATSNTLFSGAGQRGWGKGEAWEPPYNDKAGRQCLPSCDFYAQASCRQRWNEPGCGA